MQIYLYSNQCSHSPKSCTSTIYSCQLVLPFHVDPEATRYVTMITVHTSSLQETSAIITLIRELSVSGHKSVKDQ
jgi:hypothetical protein